MNRPRKGRVPPRLSDKERPTSRSFASPERLPQSITRGVDPRLEAFVERLAELLMADLLRKRPAQR
jgi:hypothetical protein